ncbi:hypothetical protein PSI9734_01656 [Pseudidiomarina piscicola]|uniref:RDD domain-containing protein n=1 Tax=Pseudidiomarina piscicola TaxID=2614830 RepID=A0A6S6WP15_9GAMM|nr:RDD family protein [Pseudidiomarina piscicola]CAB0151243.1 hypothetical protein PSI9734_01656 [Pseudidiomarina piscicola]VZT40749.1 hypothetical protein PSI9734_01656 [Pseudomonas aeruginosa]
MHDENLEYVGFWPRVGAAIIDSLLLIMVTFPIIHFVYGDAYWYTDSLILDPLDFVINYIFPAVAIILFWVYRQATPGKMAISAKIVDADTGHEVKTSRLILRYVGYYVSSIPLLLGLIWVAFDSRKQGWHDKMANTVVVRRKDRSPRPVSFDN